MTEQASAQSPNQFSTVTEDSTEDAGRLTGASRFRLIAVLALLVLFTEVAVLQVSMIGIILPKLGQAFPSSGNSTSWAITILGVVGGATVALVGKGGDLFGKKRMLLLCSMFFLVGTLLCAVTSTWAVFLLGRGIAAVSYGMAVVNYGLVRDLMPRRWIPVAVAFIGTGFGLAAIIGPLVCGLLTDHFSWRSVFWFLIIYMLVMIPLFILFVPESPMRVRQRFDTTGAVLFGAGVGAALIYLSQGSSWGWGTIGCLAYLLGGLAALAAFVAWERRASDPMMELSMLRAPGVAMVMVCAFLVLGMQTSLSVMLSYLFETPREAQLKEEILSGAAAKSHAPVAAVSRFIHFQGDVSYASGYSVLQLAVHVTIWLALFTMAFGPVAGYLARRVGARVPLIAGTISLVAASALLVNWHSTWQEQLAINVLFGLGAGFFFAAWPNLILDAVPASRQGISSGMVQVFGGVGTSVSAALLASVLAAHPFQIVTVVPGGKSVTASVPQVYTDAGFSQAYLLLGVVPCAIAVVLALALRSGRTPARGGAPATAASSVPA